MEEVLTALDPAATKRLGSVLEIVFGFGVTIADCSKIRTDLTCQEVQWRIGQHYCHILLMIYPWRAVNLVLGAQWMELLGSSYY